jgi:hypothetical protein
MTDGRGALAEALNREFENEMQRAAAVELLLDEWDRDLTRAEAQIGALEAEIESAVRKSGTDSIDAWIEELERESMKQPSLSRSPENPQAAQMQRDLEAFERRIDTHVKWLEDLRERTEAEDARLPKKPRGK